MSLITSHLPSSMVAELCQTSWQQGEYVIRPITAADDSAITAIIVGVLEEHGCVGEGYASNDEETQAMSRYYDGTTGQYWVVEHRVTGKIEGGGGFSRLKGTCEQEGIAELQKLYFLPHTRGQGLGKALIKQVEHAAHACGYRQLYLETVSHFSPAIGLYEQMAFTHVPYHLGATGHHERCHIRMVKAL